MWPERAAAFAALLIALPLAAQPIGRAPTEQEVAAWDIDVRADGRGLPPGRGSVAQGREVYAAACAACHGEAGQGGLGGQLVGGGALSGDRPAPRTIGNYWPYATTLFDYVRRAMPFNAPQSLSDGEVYAVSAFLLHLNGIVPPDATLDARTLPAIRMPNRDGFRSDGPFSP